MQPLIGISCFETSDKDWKPKIHGVRTSYINAILAAGGLPLLIPLISDQKILRSIYERVDAVFIPGGSDVDPELYGEKPHPKLGQISRLRDDVEKALITWAHQDKKPAFGVCRGIQIMNVALGGSLYQDLPEQNPSPLEHSLSDQPSAWTDTPHKLSIKPGSLLNTLLGTEVLAVNSLHHQAVKSLAPGLEAVATSEDGIIEGVESKTHPFFLAVQCHPETLCSGPDRRWGNVFAKFIESAKRK